MLKLGLIYHYPKATAPEEPQVQIQTCSVASSAIWQSTLERHLVRYKMSL
jgi:hypothetical protein